MRQGKENISQSATEQRIGISASKEGTVVASPIEVRKPKKEKDIWRKPHPIRTAIIGAGGGVAAVAIIAAGQRHIQQEEEISLSSITRSIKAVPDQVAGWFSSEVPTTFDIDYKGNTKTVVTVNNSIGVSTPEAEQFTAVIEAPKDSDLSAIPGMKSSQIEYYKSEVPLLEIPLPFTVTPESDISVEYGFLETNGSPLRYAIKINGLPDNKILYAPKAGELSVTQTGTGRRVHTSVGIQFKDTNGDTHSMGFDLGAGKSLISEDQAPKTILKNSEGIPTGWKQTIQVNVGDPFFSLTHSPISDKNTWFGQQLTIVLPVEAEDIEGKLKMKIRPIVIKTIGGKATFILPQ